MKAKWMRVLSVIVRIAGPILGAVLGDITLFKSPESISIAIGGMVSLLFAYFVLMDELKRKGSATRTFTLGIIILVIGYTFGSIAAIAMGAVISSIFAIILDMSYNKINKPITTDELWEKIKENK